MTFSEFKDKISIIEVAVSLGYTFDKNKGISQPSFILTGFNGEIIDRIYIKNPNNPSQQGYWRRGTTAQMYEKGDLILFVKENLRKFSQSRNAKNEIDGINKVLLSFSKSGANVEDIMNKFDNSRKVWKPRKFDLSRYERENENIKEITKRLEKRGFKEKTIKVFSNFIEIIKDKNSKYNYKNIGFPYRIPGKDNIVGYEVRGFGGFKGKAEGSDSTKGVWIADFTKDKNNARNIYFYESALDGLAFYQHNQSKIELDKSVFISTGGSFSEHQFRGVMKYYHVGKPILCFDADENGKMYDIKAFAILKNIPLSTKKTMDNVEFSINDKKFQLKLDEFDLDKFLKETQMENNLIQICKAPNKLKDWNDVIQQKPNIENIPNRFDFIKRSNR